MGLLDFLNHTQSLSTYRMHSGNCKRYEELGREEVVVRNNRLFQGLITLRNFDQISSLFGRLKSWAEDQFDGGNFPLKK